jgi:hypothetical protein
MVNPNESWQVDVNGEVLETNFQGLIDWIDEGSLLRIDKVRRGNLRWLEAGKIPLLYGFFNAKDMGQPMPLVQFSTTEAEISIGLSTEMPTIAAESTDATQNFAPSQTNVSPANNWTVNENLPPTQIFQPHVQNFYQPQLEQQIPANGVCLIHEDAEASYVCDTCVNQFCKECPKGYGGAVKICPMCGSMCSSIKQIQQTQVQSMQFQNDMNEGFGIRDFGRAFVYPFKFKVSLFFGAFLFMLFTLGQSASGSGSFMMLAPVIICFMMSNMLSFGILANTVENFSHGKVGGNFMPSFDEFSLWDDMIHPFFLSLGTYIVSFGLLFVIIVGSTWIMWDSVSKGIKKESDAVMEAINKKKEAEAKLKPANIFNDNDRAYQQDVDNMNKQMQIDKLKSLGAADPDAGLSTGQITSTIVKKAGFLAVPILLALLWGIFYYPIACAVAGYTRSLAATLNPLVGLDTIKRLGFDYVKILGMTLILVVISGSIGFLLSLIFAPFDLPRMGNLPAIAIGSWFTFYFSIVFSIILGYALYKNTEKMNLFRG